MVDLTAWWGKADSVEGQKHPLVYHSLDVAAVGSRLLAAHPRLARTLSELTGFDQETLTSWACFFLAIHDLGKFSSAFQYLRPALAPAHTRCTAYRVRHDALGLQLWTGEIGPRLLDAGRWDHATSLGREYLPYLLESWAGAVTGHHGKPVSTGGGPLSRHFAPEDIAAAIAWSEMAADQFLTAAAYDWKTLYSRLPVASWWLAGFAVLSDWIGSNQDFFRCHPESIPLADYWRDTALPAAECALDATGLLPVPAHPQRPLQELFVHVMQPTPLQAECIEIGLSSGPYLFLLEDITGAGKTEAAFALLHRLLASGEADGAYLALPTMATANAMYRRTASVYRKLYGISNRPVSLVLAHGHRHLDDGFRDSVLPPASSSGTYGPGEHDASANCNAWLADNPKRALLAPMGVGTVDQALLAVLQSRHQSLRLTGLVGKVLMVDEVHASDAYMHELLCELLRAHAHAGGSAILLSATLSGPMRRQLVEAWCRGRGIQALTPEVVGYPLLTRVGVDGVTCQPVAPRPGTDRTLAFRSISDVDTTVEWVRETAARGACVAWIRNTVADALEAFARLEPHLPAGTLTLFHARFAMRDRLRIENLVLDDLGPGSSPASRHGRVVVATQVIEQSLDLDFDEMVSDLAPIDLLLQRAGRLRRHARDPDGLRISGLDQRGDMTLHVHMPDPEVGMDPEWYRRAFPRSAYVYPDHAQLWRTAYWINQREALRFPEQLREWIDAIFGDLPTPELPEGLLRAELTADGRRRSDASVARMNRIKIEQGYLRTEADWPDDTTAPTRLGEPTRRVRLARWDGTVLSPWAEVGPYRWAASELTLRRALLDSVEAPYPGMSEATDATRAEWGASHVDTLLIPLEPCTDGTVWEAVGRDADGRRRHIRYTSTLGLQINKETL